MRWMLVAVVLALGFVSVSAKGTLLGYTFVCQDAGKACVKTGTVLFKVKTLTATKAFEMLEGAEQNGGG